MAFPATNLAELPFRNSLSLSTHSPPALNLNLLFVAPKRSFQLLKPLSSLKNPHYSGNRNPRNNRSTPSSKPKPPSAPWLANDLGEPKVAEKVSKSNTEGQNDRGQGAVERIVLRLRNLGLGSDDDEEDEELEEQSAAEPVTEEEKLGDLLRRDWGRPESLLDEDMEEGTVLPWEREEEKEVVVGGRIVKMREGKPSSLAELTLGDEELRRLRTRAMQHREKINVPKAGITQAVLDKIHGKWKKDELVKPKFHEVLSHDMKTAHEIVEAQAKKLKAEKLLSKIEASMVTAGPDYDQETITDEERVMFRMIGLRMKPYLPLGVRGVFDGVIENMHLHWKHRELVKLITGQKNLAFVEDTARLLEFESGGILVAIERLPKGHAVIYYRGKNYQRPVSLRPRNLLTKAKALKRSVAMQRHEALSEHISGLEATIEQMKKDIVSDHLPPLKPFTSISSPSTAQSRHELPLRVTAQPPLSFFSALSSFVPSPANELPPNFTPEQLIEALHRQKDEASVLRVFNWASKQPNFTPTSFLYNEVLRRLGSVQSMRHFLDEMKLADSDKITTGNFPILAQTYADSEMYEEALRVVDLMEGEFGLKPDRYFYNCLLNILVEGSKLKLVENAHSDMVSRGIKPNVSTFNILIKALCRAHQIRPAILLMEEMPSLGLAPDETTFVTLMQGYIDEGDLYSALKVKGQMMEAGCSWSNKMVNVLINGFCKAGRIEDALGFIHKMCTEGFNPDQFSFNTLVSGLSKEGHVDQATEIMDIMFEHGFDPDIFTYNCLITALCKLGEVGEAAELLSLMISRDCYPNTVTFNILIGTLCKENKIDEATELARFLARKGVVSDVCTFNSLIQGLCSTNNYRAAMQLFEEMKTKGLQPDEFTYNILINSLCSRGKLSDALDMLKEMESNGCARNIVTYNTLIDGFCKNRKIEQAEEVFDQMELLGVSRNTVTYNTLIDGLCKVRRVEDAMHVVEQMIMEGLKPNRVTYNSLLAHYCRAGDMERAADIVATMTSNGCEPDMVNYGTLIGGLCKAGRTHVAVTVLRSIQSKGMVPTPDVYNPVIQALFKRRVTKEAMTLFREMIQIGDPPNSITYKIVFRGLCNGGGPIGEAVDFAFEMMEHGVLPEFPSFYNLADGLCALSMESTLVRLVDMMVEKANVSEREAPTITGFLKIGKFEDALGTLDHIFARRNPRRPYQWRA